MDGDNQDNRTRQLQWVGSDKVLGLPRGGADAEAHRWGAARLVGNGTCPQGGPSCAKVLRGRRVLVAPSVFEDIGWCGFKKRHQAPWPPGPVGDLPSLRQEPLSSALSRNNLPPDTAGPVPAGVEGPKAALEQETHGGRPNTHPMARAGSGAGWGQGGPGRASPREDKGP